MSDKDRGLYNKYIVARADGRRLEEGAEYFVLRLDTRTPAALAAIRAYADAIRATHPQLAQDLVAKYGSGEDLRAIMARMEENLEAIQRRIDHIPEFVVDRLVGNLA